MTHASAPHQAGSRACETRARTTWRNSERFHRLATLSSHLSSPDPSRKAKIDEIIRVDHAGETAAVRIYEGQMFVLGRNKETAETLEHMRMQEVEHLSDLDVLVADRRVRPSALLPVWEVAGFALGAVTAAMGKEAAMACTVAVEDVIGGHYNDQIRDLLARGWDEEELLALLKKNRDEELEHLETATELGAERAPLHAPLTQIIKTGCKAAIEVAKVI
ncbi:hypothetical protein FNF27_00970 [Cafeteria roenbergensis]|uniref:5-demethoxyubiquinone hydroxylase, mitochondrial n=1 Tax=Cafeteria roenbergensis TaxID=33653 RepID=A0A5A8E099_CAFRO|nr:hypothetical protein FNF31_00410 [Cafeteria roenbergensis]KAA0171186.1 hypothetical protein FNF28_00952 [Cafeteria roenbergensis]KAA0177799.1 hypothetical protein FNF27_00970 [Cafeteria roenbergensis]